MFLRPSPRWAIEENVRDGGKSTNGASTNQSARSSKQWGTKFRLCAARDAKSRVAFYARWSK